MVNIEPCVAIIPAHNEETTVADIVARVRATQLCAVVVIDDCSSDDTVRCAQAAGATVLPLSIQLGAWGAAQTGIRYALKNGYRTVITLDADGQHYPESIGELLTPLANGRADVMVGAFPERASAARRIAWRFFRHLTGLNLRDITSGFRAYNHQAMRALANKEASLLDYQDVGVLLILRRKQLKIREVAVEMQPRIAGASRIFRSWLTVGKYMLQTTLMCIARVGYDNLSADED